MNSNNVEYDFVECYDEEKVTTTFEELREYQNKYDKVLLFLGQYQHDESEGIDRSTIELRPQQIKVLNMVKELFGAFATVLVSGCECKRGIWTIRSNDRYLSRWRRTV